jgi:hypothetical protein
MEWPENSYSYIDDTMSETARTVRLAKEMLNRAS